MSQKRYPKSFYDDGLGDFIEWLDDEVLVHTETKKLRERDKPSRKRGHTDDSTQVELKEKTKSKSKKSLYGDNNVEEETFSSRRKRVQFNVYDDDENEHPKSEKNVEDRTRGLINRLAAQTMPFVTSEFEKLYSTNPRAAINATIFRHIESSVINKHAIAKRKLIAELMLLISYLSNKINEEIGAYFVHRLVAKLEHLCRETYIDDGDKRAANVICCLTNLYAIGLISCNVMFEISKRICSRDFSPRSIELVMLIIMTVGFQMRKDSPSLMRQLIIMAQDAVKDLKGNETVNSRVEFMIESLNAIKNNNVSRLTNYGCDIDRDTIESTMKSLMKRTRLPECLSDATYDEILNSANFYLLDTRLEEEDTSVREPESNVIVDDCSASKDRKICKALSLNKPAERTVFSALVKATDYIEASNLIIGFGFKYCSDAMLVCLQVAIHEKSYNPFYADLINNLCKFDRRYKMAAKFAIQDKIRALGSMPTKRAAVFKVLCLELLKIDAVPITIMKSIEWANLSASTKDFLTHILEAISRMSEEERRKLMCKVDKHSSFAGAMRTFGKCFLNDCQLFN